MSKQDSPIPETIKPSKWFQEETYRKVFTWDKEKAPRVRKALAREELYYTKPVGDKPDERQKVANFKAALRVLIEDLDDTDLCAVYALVRLLVLVPRKDDLFDFIKERSRIILEIHGYKMNG